MKKYTIYQIDSFTTTMFKGNPAGVVLNAEGLSDSDMQQIAREMNNSETAFFFSPSDVSYDGELRYFTPSTEVPTCGHATVAALYAKAREENWGNRSLRIRTKVGVLPMEVIKHEDDYLIAMTQGRIEISEPLGSQDRTEILRALGLSEDDMDQRCPIQIASTGHSKVMIGIKEVKRLNEIEPDSTSLVRLSKKLGCNGYFVFTFDTVKKDVLTEGRMFAPAIGIAEDPVTGNANGPLGAYLIRNRIVACDHGFFKFIGHQGERMGRPGNVLVEVTVRNERPESVKILGQATIVYKTEISI
jgi:PhzF family phenazine biosynthesis protein